MFSLASNLTEGADAKNLVLLPDKEPGNHADNLTVALYVLMNNN